VDESEGSESSYEDPGLPGASTIPLLALTYVQDLQPLAPTPTAAPTAAHAPTSSPPPCRAATYAEVASTRRSRFPPIRLTHPWNRYCERCDDSPVYETNYGFFCDICLRGQFYFNPDCDMYLL
jgi:hypothetical protein